MVVENYINELRAKNDKNTIKRIVKEYNKEIEFKLKSPAINKPSNAYFISITGLIESLGVLYFRSENISLIINIIYVLPLLVFSIISIVLFTKHRIAKRVDVKLFFTLGNFVLLQFFGMFFAATYMFQFVIFDTLDSVDYLKSISIFIVLLIPAIVVGIRTAPQKFIKQFSQHRTYKEQSEISIWIFIALISLVNITKPYMLLLIGFYSVSVYITPKLIFVAYKARKYDYIQSLRKG